MGKAGENEFTYRLGGMTCLAGDVIGDYSFDEPDFAFVQYRSNLVVRWEYIPGSEIFLVWSQGVNGMGDPTDSLFENLNKEIVQQQPDNTYLFKITYRYVF